MASGPPPPLLTIDSPTPSIVFDLTSDDDDSSRESRPSHSRQTHRHLSPDSRFETGSLGWPESAVPVNPHEAALLRRSPSPVLLLPSDLPPPPRRTPSPDPRLSRRSFLLPSDAMADDLSSPLSSNASTGPINIAAKPAGSPFNFQTQYISTSPVKSNIGLRRGHRYKHSSVSTQHQIFQEPPPRPPPVLPASLPLPTLREAWGSMQRDQRARFFWCLCHGAVAVFVFLCASADTCDSLALTALSHLVFFDVGSAAVCVAVDVLGNFEVWRRSTIRHPFGLRRAEVLAGFAMSIFLVFGGFDLLSHGLKDIFEATAPALAPEDTASSISASSASSPLDITLHDTLHRPSHAGHDYGHGHSHGHGRYVGPGSIDLAALAAFASTLVSAYGLGNHARIRRALLLLHGVGLPSSALPAVLANPFHFLTLAVSLLLLAMPLVFVAAVPTWLDRLLCAAMAASMSLLGARLAVAQGLMLLMSYSGSRPTDSPEESTNDNTSAVLDDIAAEPQVARVEDAQFWQVHYGLCMANLRVRVVRGCDDSALRQLRARVARVVQNRLGEGYGRGNSLRWEVTVQTSVDA